MIDGDVGAIRGAVLALVLTLVIGACSEGSKGSPGQRLGPNKTPVACDLFGPLDSAAAKIKAADPSDPVSFAKALADAKAQYLDGLEKLNKELPSAIQPAVAEVKVLVETDDFVAAAKARSPITKWVADNC